MDREIQFIRYEKLGKIGRITLNRPEISNAFNEQMLEDLRKLVQEIDWQGEARVLIFRGSGRGFSSGYDLESVIRREDKSLHWDIMRNKGLIRLLDDIRTCNMPTIGQLHGYCLNGALDLAFQFDFLVASENCLIGYPALRCFGSSLVQAWHYHVRPQWARYMMMTGDVINGREAEKIGLVIKAVDHAKLEETVIEFAERLANVDKDLLAAHKAIVNKGLDLMGYRTMQEVSAENDCVTHQTEAVRKLLNKASVRGTKAITEAVNAGFKPQAAPFEYVEPEAEE